jgi:hypothetical protein
MQESPRILGHLGDPNYFLSTNPLSRRTYKLEYEMKTGWDINVNIPDSIPLRHDRIKQLVKYDPEQELNTMNRPHLYVFDTCENVKRAFLGYCWQMASGKEGGLSDRLEKKWMCPMSCVGYTVTAVEGWEAKTGSGGKSEYDEIRSAQDPDFYDPHEMSLEEHYDGERFC